MAIHRDRDGHTHQLEESAEKPTRLINRNAAKQALLTDPVPPVADEHTRLYGADGVGEFDEASLLSPVVGWLVIIAGPGRGRAMTLGYGMNSIGRGPESRICLDFGDKQISRESHALISYDPRGRRFYLQHGGGTNLTYLDGQPVLAPIELCGGQIISLGQTQLHFVPFCGAAFDWQDSDPETP